jgi:hypothetical protein
MYFPYLSPRNGEKPTETPDGKGLVEERARPRKRFSPFGRSLLVALGTAFCMVLFLTPLLGNVYYLIANRGYFIPSESSVLTFRVLVWNLGSGEWWLRGEDWNNFYAIHDKEWVYFVFPKRALDECPAFSPVDLTTWCAALTKKAAYPA